MTTKLDELVGYLAGREGDPRFQEELADPASEVNLFLVAARNRSRSLIQEPLPSKKPGRLNPVRLATGPMVWASGVVVAIFIVIWFIDLRLSRLEIEHQQTAAESKAASDRLFTALEQIRTLRTDQGQTEQNGKILARVEAELARLEGLLEPQQRSSPPANPEPSISQLRDEITANLRRELNASEKSRARQIEELQGSIHEMGRVLRLILTRLEPASSLPEPPRNFVPNQSPGTIDPSSEP